MLTRGMNIETLLADRMGYPYCVLFPRGRDALAAYVKEVDRVVLPSNVCPEIAEYAKKFEVVDDTGQGGCAHLYGYRQPFHPHELDLDPLMTGWCAKPFAPNAIVSFGRYKITDTWGGGAFLTNYKWLRDKFEGVYMPSGLLEPIHRAINTMSENLEKRWKKMDKWDQELGDLLIRIPRQQVMPWRCMRMCPKKDRDSLVRFLRDKGVAVSTNYPPVTGKRNLWGDMVIGFPLKQNERYVAMLIKRYLEE